MSKGILHAFFIKEIFDKVQTFPFSERISKQTYTNPMKWITTNSENTWDAYGVSKQTAHSIFMCCSYHHAKWPNQTETVFCFIILFFSSSSSNYIFNKHQNVSSLAFQPHHFYVGLAEKTQKICRKIYSKCIFEIAESGNVNIYISFDVVRNADGVLGSRWHLNACQCV